MIMRLLLMLGKLKLEQCQSQGQTRLEAVEGALLLFLVEGEHALFELSARSLGFTAGTALLFDGLEGQTGRAAFLAEGGEFILECPGLLLPGLAVALNFGALGFKVAEGLFQGSGQLLLGVQVLFDCSNSSFLVLDQLDVGQLFAGVSRAGRGHTTVGVRGDGRERRERDRRWRRGKRSSGRALAEIGC